MIKVDRVMQGVHRASIQELTNYLTIKDLNSEADVPDLIQSDEEDEVPSVDLERTAELMTTRRFMIWCQAATKRALQTAHGQDSTNTSPWCSTWGLWTRSA